MKRDHRTKRAQREQCIEDSLKRQTEQGRIRGVKAGIAKRPEAETRKSQVYRKEQQIEEYRARQAKALQKRRKQRISHQDKFRVEVHIPKTARHQDDPERKKDRKNQTERLVSRDIAAQCNPFGEKDAKEAEECRRDNENRRIQIPHKEKAERYAE